MAIGSNYSHLIGRPLEARFLYGIYGGALFDGCHVEGDVLLNVDLNTNGSSVVAPRQNTVPKTLSFLTRATHALEASHRT